MGHVQVANFIDVFTRFIVMVNTSGTPSSSRAIGHCNSPTIWGHAVPSQQVFVPNEKHLYMLGIIYDWLYHMSYAIKEHIRRSLTQVLWTDSLVVVTKFDCTLLFDSRIG